VLLHQHQLYIKTQFKLLIAVALQQSQHQWHRLVAQPAVAALAAVLVAVWATSAAVDSEVASAQVVVEAATLAISGNCSAVIATIQF
jgi:hypothetical protein